MFRRYKVTVIYKSGARQTFRCKDFTLRHKSDGRKEVEWTNDARPRPLLFGLDDVAAIWSERA